MTTHLAAQPKCTEHFAVERTFLAWGRTGIAPISPGAVVAKCGVCLRGLSARLLIVHLLSTAQSR